MAVKSLTSAKRVELTTKFEGPFFDLDPARTFRENVREMMAGVAAEAEADIKAQIEGNAAQMPEYTGWSRDHVVGRTESLGGKRWAVSAVISASTNGMSARDAIRTKAAAASIERRFHPFSRTARAIRVSRAVMAANLTKGFGE